MKESTISPNDIIANLLSMNFDHSLLTQGMDLISAAKKAYEEAEHQGDLKYNTFQGMLEDIHILASEGCTNFDMKIMLPILASTADPNYAKMVACQTYRRNLISTSMDIFGKRYRKYHTRYADMPVQCEKAMHGIETDLQIRCTYQQKNKNKKADAYKIRKPYKENLNRIVNYLIEEITLPTSVIDAFNSACLVPEYYQKMKYVLPHLYGVLDGGLHEVLAKKNQENVFTDRNDWYSAIELALAATGLNDRQIAQFPDPDENEEARGFINIIGPTIVAFALLIHDLRLFSTQEHLDLLYGQKGDAKNEKSTEDKLLQQVQKLTAQINTQKKENALLKKSIGTLRNQISNFPTKNKDLSEMNHRHNKEIKEKDEEIEQLRKLTARLELEVTRLEAQAMEAAESAAPNKPWLGLELPADSVVFVGGHPNMVKKLQVLHSKWTFISDEYFLNLPTRVEAIFCWTNHMSHRLWQKLDSFYLSREKLLYVTATNLERLDEEMKYALWNLQQKEENT